MARPLDPHYDQAVSRFQLLAPLLDPELDAAEARIWRAQICSRADISPRTLRRWLQAYAQHGLEGLAPKIRRDKGVRRTLSDDAFALASEWRRELPARSAERLCELLRQKGHHVARSTLERHLRQNGLSKRTLKQEATTTLPVGRRFQHQQRNSLWQTDFKDGPRLPDPQQPGRTISTHLLVFLDDATRKVLHAEFYLDQTTRSLMDGFRKALLSAGCPRTIYLDNGKQFVSTWMQLACARLGIRHLATQPYSPESKGKVERFNRTVDEFMAELTLEPPCTLLQLNQKLYTWIREGYNQRPHHALSSDHPTPEAAFAASSAPLRMVRPEALRSAFLWEEERMVDKAGCVQLEGRLLDTGLNLTRKKVTLRYDPLDLTQVEIFHRGHSQGMAHLVQIGEHNGVKRTTAQETTPKPQTGSVVLQMLARKERQRLQSELGAFQLSSKDGEPRV